jgi:hypothetical protein
VPGASLPQRDNGSSQRDDSGSLPQRGNGGSPSAWAPPEQPRSSAGDGSFGRPAEPHPYRPGEGDSGEIAGFAPGSPTRGRPSFDDDQDSGGPYTLPDRSPQFGSGADPESPNGSRPPGVSAFGDQRVRVPGATLTGLPDEPSGVPAARDEFSGGGVTRREGDGSALPRRTAPSGDPLLSFGSTADSFEGFRPTGSGRGGQSPDSRGSTAYTPRASQAFGASRNAGASPFGGHPDDPSSTPSQDDSPFGARPSGDGASPSEPTSDSFQFGAPPPVQPGGSPFGPPPAGGSPFGETAAGGPFPAQIPAQIPDSSAPHGSDGRTAEPYGRPDGRSFEPGADSPFVQRVPGASFGTPVEASGNGSVPQPRDPGERPAVGTARPVSASASVPTGSRVTPVDAEEIPPVAAAPQARVYGRATPAADNDEDSADHSMYARPSRDDQANAPVSPYGDQHTRPADDDNGFGASPYGRAAAESDGDAFGRGPDGGRFGAPTDDGPNGQAPYGRRSVEGRSAGDGEDGPYGRRTDEDEQRGPGGFGAAAATPFGTRAGDQGSPFGADQDQGSPFGAHSDEDQGSPFGGRPDQGPASPFGARPDQASPFGARPEQEQGSPFDARPDQGSPFDARPDQGSPFEARPGQDQGSPFGARPEQDQASSFGGPAEQYGRRGDRPADQNGSSSYGRPADGPAGATPYGRPVEDDSSRSGAAQFGRPNEQFGRPGGDEPGGGFGAAPVSPYGRRSEDDPNGPGGFSPAEAQPPVGGPPTPARASGRATASARVTPPAPSQAQPGQPPIPGQPIPGQPMPGQPIPGQPMRGQPMSGQPTSGQPGPATPADHYGEHTTDISRRGQSDQPYVPAPALPSLHARPPLENGFPAPADGTESPDRMRMGGVFPGPGNRSTVTPPNPDETTSWPRPGEPDQGAQSAGWPRPGESDQVTQNAGWPRPGESDQVTQSAGWPRPGEAAQGVPSAVWPQPGTEPEQGRFDQFKADAEPAAVPATPATPHVRMLPIILGVIIGAALLVGLPTGIVWLISRGSDSGGISVSAGDCVKRSGTEAVKATCGDPGTFQVASVADSKEKCADPTQPYVVNPTKDGKSQVLCLKPSS